MRRRRRNKVPTSLVASLLLLCSGCSARDDAPEVEAQAAKPKLGLFTTLPIYWGEGGMEAIIAGNSAPDWVRVELETKFELVPLDTLETDALEGIDRVLLAQPRPLAPSENVAFDQFLAGGGTALILADPMLTRHSDYGIGDRRRPQDVVVLSPILNRLGVRLQFDEEQPQGERIVNVDGRQYPVHLAGSFEKVESGSSSRTCDVLDGALLAHCANGQGEAFLYADAALLDWEGDDPVPESRKEALWSLLMPLVSKGSTHRQN